MTTRRTFLQLSAAAAGALAAPLGSAQAAANEKVVIGVMGVNGRGSALTKGFAASGQAEVAYVCDVDSRNTAKAAQLAAATQRKAPRQVEDFRKILDDKSVDALVIAAPDHWHAPATILACEAGKHVYVEKPCSHNPAEGEMAVAAARKHGRVVTMGNQRRSWPKIVEGMQRLHEGVIGPARFAKAWYNNRRGPIGKGRRTTPPEWLNFELWQGPAPRRPFQDNLIHYNWHWFWNWGTGELGNNGVHALDLARWGLQVSYPTQVSSAGGRYFYDDDWETPDTQTASFEFGDKLISWTGLSCQPRGLEGTGFGASFHGPQGTLVIDGGGYKIYDPRNKLVASESGPGGDADHIGDFLQSIREEARPNSDIEGAHQSTLLCHLGNIAFRVGRTLRCDPTNGHILEDEGATALWSREYADGWRPRV